VARRRARGHEGRIPAVEFPTAVISRIAALYNRGLRIHDQSRLGPVLFL
jgi:hypothetical protein